MIQQIEKPLGFLLQSIDPKTKGSRAYYSKFFNPISGWSNPYPETTGYIIKTFDCLIEDFNYTSLETHSDEMGEWLLSIQNTDGSFQGGLYTSNNSTKSVFNTAQILIGLRSRFELSKDKRFLNSGIKASEWIINQIDENGLIVTNAYKEGYMPSYYTRVCWPTLLFADDCSSSSKNKIKKVLDVISERQLVNSFIVDSGFKPNQPAVLHTIAYTIRGFLESSNYYTNDVYFNIAKRLSEKLLSRYEITKRLNGEYDENFKFKRKYRCLTGEAQMAIIWMKIYQQNHDARYLNAALKIIDSLSHEVPKFGFVLKSGGLAGSKPYFEKYMRLRQPNWASKFYIDAIIEREKSLKLLR